MKISAKIIQHSVSQGIDLVTFELEYPRFIHSELMTHRVFSRNAASSRAIPIRKMMEQVLETPASPVFWGLDMAGMKAKAEHTDPEECKRVWLNAANSAVKQAEELQKLGLHKQVVNRVLEPFQTMKTVVTATEWSNFYELRMHKDAQPEFRVLAKLMWSASKQSEPLKLCRGEWHTPYVSRYRCPEYEGLTYFIDDEAQTDLTLQQAIMISSSCCAQVSYRVLDESLDKALKIYKQLVTSKPMHASPFEHQATPAENNNFYANFKGWSQHRSMLG